MNGPTGVDWIPGIVALVAGLVLGALLLRKVMASAAAAPAAEAGGKRPEPALEVRDLEAKRDALLDQLRELTALAATRTPEQLARERYALELDAARVLRDLTSRHAGPSRAARKKAAAAAAAVAVAGETTDPELAEAAAEPATGMSPALRGFLWTVATVGCIGAIGYSVTRSAKARSEGGSMTGSTPMEEQRAATPSGAPQAADPQELAIKSAISKDPNDLEARLALARLYLQRQDMMGVWNETQFVLQRSPGEPHALSYQSLVRLAMGQPDLALTMLKQAQAKAPDQIDVYVHQMLVYLRMGKAKEAEAIIADASRRFPPRAQELAALLERMKTETASEPPLPKDAHAGIAGPGEADPHAGLGVPPAGPAPAPVPVQAAAAPSASATGGFSGTVELDPGLRAPPGALVFVSLREAGTEGGPPLAAKRMQADAFPLRFEIGPGDTMMGGELPAKVRLDVRIDSDGDPMTKSPSDPQASVDGLKLGTSGIRLVLRTK